MRAVECAWHKIYTVGIRVFLVFAALGLLSSLFGLLLKETVFNGGYLLALIFLINGVGWLGIGLFGLAKHKTVSKKLSLLKSTGDLYEVTIKEMAPVWYVQIGGYVMAAAKGYYTDSSGKTQPFKSAHYAFTTFDKKDDFGANVYVDPKNPESHGVELFRKK